MPIQASGQVQLNGKVLISILLSRWLTLFKTSITDHAKI